MMRVTRQPLNGGGWNPSSARLPCCCAWLRRLGGRLKCGRPSETAKSGFGRLDRKRKPSPELNLPLLMPLFSAAWVTVYGSYPVTKHISSGSGMLLACFSAACAVGTPFGHRARSCSTNARAGCHLIPPKRRLWRNCARDVIPIPVHCIILVTPALYFNT